MAAQLLINESKAGLRNSTEHSKQNRSSLKNIHHAVFATNELLAPLTV